MKPKMNQIEVRTYLTLEKPFPKSRLKELLLYEWCDEKGKKDTFATPITKEQEKYLNEYSIFIKELPDSRTGRTVEIGGHKLKYTDEYHLEFSSATEDEARIKYLNDIKPELVLLGFDKIGTTCKPLFEGEESICLNENLNAYKE